MTATQQPLLTPGGACQEVARAHRVQLRIADEITAFAGSMPFVYIHVAAFALWMLLVEREPVADADPRGLARGDLPVDLRDDRPEPQAAFQQAKADHDFVEQELELKTNTELTREMQMMLNHLRATPPRGAGLRLSHLTT